jgi:hypothetical protein
LLLLLRFSTIEEYKQRTHIDKPPRVYLYIFDTLKETLERYHMRVYKDSSGTSNVDELDFKVEGGRKKEENVDELDFKVEKRKKERERGRKRRMCICVESEWILN